MIKILFICHGNICRSPMAEFVLKDMVKKRGLSDQFVINSAATSTEEIGSNIHQGTQNKLRSVGIPFAPRSAIQLRKKDYDKYDYLIGMDSRNITNTQRMVGQSGAGKVCRLLDFTDHPRDISDPWYSGNFDLTYDDVVEGCEALLQFILSNMGCSQ